MAESKKIVLANSLGVEEDGYSLLHYPSRWTTGVKRARFNWYPWELAYASSLLKRDTEHSVKLLDGCLEWWDFDEYLKRIVDESPDYLVMESSSRSFEGDLKLAKAVRDKCGCKLIFAGQHPTAYPDEVAEEVDYVCIGEYEETLKDIVTGIPRGDILGLYPNPPRPLLDFSRMPWPEDEDVSRYAYCDPGPPGLKYRQIQAYASRGCPMGCNFCVTVDLYYHGEKNWRPRDIDDIVKEIKYLREKYPRMEGIFFDEEVHTLKKSFNIELSKALIKEGLSDLHYTAMGLYSTLDGETLEWMARAGYDQIRIGIETIDESSAKKMGLGGKYRPDKLMDVLRAAKEVGIDIYGTFTVGGMGSTEESDRRTIAFMEELLKEELLWELQVSICTPQPGTRFFKEAGAKGYLKASDKKDFDGTKGAVVSYPDYPAERIEKVFCDATDLGHYYRGLLKLKREGLFKVLSLSFRRRGLLGTFAFAWQNKGRLIKDIFIRGG